jgi:hypothetical protein
MRVRVIGVLVAATALALPASALADGNVYCVESTFVASKPGCSAVYIDVQSALTAAYTSANEDTVQIGPGTFYASSSSDFYYDGGSSLRNTVSIVGAGRGATKLVRTAPGVVLDVKSAQASSIRDLTVAPAAGTNDTTGRSVGIRSPTATLTSVTVDPSAATAYVTGFELGTGTLSKGTALLPSGTSATNIGAKFTNTVATARADVDGAALSGGIGLDVATPELSVNASRVTGASYGLRGSIGARNGQIANSVVRSSADGIHFEIVGDADVFLLNTTILGSGAAGSGIWTTAYAGGPTSTDVNLHVNSSIIRGFLSSFSGQSFDNGPAQARVNAIARYSDLKPGVTGPGHATYDGDTSNIDADPIFVNPSTGDYTPAANSPVVDKGLPGTLSAGGSSGAELDLVGNLRVVDGNGDGTARRDIGAVEYQPPPPPGSPTPDGTTPTTPTTPGDAVAPGGGSAVTAASVTALGLSPTRFRAAASGPEVKAAARRRKPKPGTVVAFTLTQPGTTAFTIERKTTGRRGGAKCVKATRKNRKARKCTLYVPVKSSGFTRDGAAGANKFRLTGRVGKKALKPGSYRLVATTSASVRRTSFKVVR